MSRFSRAALAVFSVLLLALASVDAATFTVTDTVSFGDGSLGRAIQNANSTPGADTIVFDLPGAGPHFIDLEFPFPPLSGDLEIINDRPGDEMVTVRRLPGNDAIELRIFKIAPGSTVLIAGLTISNGKLVAAQTAGGEVPQGGGIYNDAALLTLRKCTVTGNTASDAGGGIFTSEQSGNASLTMIDCTVSGNSSFGVGGGIINSARNSRTSDLVLINCTLSGNSCSDSGGAIHNGVSGTGSRANLSLSNSTVSGNTAGQSGAGILNSGSVLGGESVLSLNNCTFANNNAVNLPGNAIRNISATVDVRNTIFQRGGIRENLSNQGTFNSLGHNISDDEAGGGTGTSPGGLLNASSDRRNTDPKLTLLQNNGGPTLTHGLLRNSPAVDAGDDAVLGPPLNLATDQRGSGFVRKSGTSIDIGAFERSPVLVTTTAEHDDGSCNATDCTLLEAISAASAYDGTVQFLPGLSGTILTTQTPATGLSITQPLTIEGPGARVMTVSGNDAGKVFTVSAGPVVISGLTISNGASTTTGGGIYNTGNLTINNCTVGSNRTTASGAHGGGIANAIIGATLAINNCTLTLNTAFGSGGGLYNVGGTSIRNSTFSGNRGSSGGAIFSERPGFIGAGVSLRNCTIARNRGGSTVFNGTGGGIRNGENSTITVDNSLIALNNAGVAGPDLFGFFVSQGYNLIGNKADSTGLNHGTKNDQVGGAPNPPLDPKLDTLKDNGGPTDTLALLADSSAINASNDATAPALDQRGAPRSGVSDIGAFEFGAVPPTPTPTPIPARLANISTRLRVETGDNVLIGGFIITGTQPKKVIIRGIGTSLPLPDKLQNPTLELHGPNGLIDANDNWIDSTNKQAIIDSTIPPTSDLESAIVATLPANGAGYTAIVRGANDGTGIGVIEAYDLDTAVDSKLANISTRGFVQTGDNVLIAGTIIVGELPQKVLVRAIGPSLPFPGVLADPVLELRDQYGGLVAGNDNWRSTQEAEIIATTIPPTNDFESAVVATLPANGASYTAIVRGVNDSTGIAVIEVFALQ